MWSAPPRTTPGGQPVFADLAIELCLTPGMVFQQPLCLSLNAANKTHWNVAITVVCLDQRDLNIAAGTMLCAAPRGTALQLLEERGENIFHYEIIYSL